MGIWCLLYHFLFFSIRSTCFSHITHTFQNFIHITESEWKFNLIFINKNPKPWIDLISSPPRETCWIFKIVTDNISLLCYWLHLLSRSTRSNHYQNKFNFTEVFTASWKASSLGKRNTLLIVSIFLSPTNSNTPAVLCREKSTGKKGEARNVRTLDRDPHLCRRSK